jgi:hypothetical protein
MSYVVFPEGSRTHATISTHSQKRHYSNDPSKLERCLTDCRSIKEIHIITVIGDQLAGLRGRQNLTLQRLPRYGSTTFVIPWLALTTIDLADMSALFTRADRAAQSPSGPRYFDLRSVSLELFPARTVNTVRGEEADQSGLASASPAEAQMASVLREPIWSIPGRE